MAPPSRKKRNHHSSDPDGIIKMEDPSSESSKSPDSLLDDGEKQSSQQQQDDDKQQSSKKKMKKTTTPEEKNDKDGSEHNHHEETLLLLKKSSPSLLPSALPSSDEHSMKLSSLDDDNERIKSAHSHLLQVRAKYQRVKTELANAQKAYDDACASSKERSEKDAEADNDEWNSWYGQLKAYFDQEGHSTIVLDQQEVLPTDGEEATSASSSEQLQQAQLYALSQWANQQRMEKENGALEDYKIALLDCLNFGWDAKHKASDTDMWLKNYHLLQEFKRKHGHVDVPAQDKKLALWVKTQLTLYRNGKENKLPALSLDRIRKLEKIGIKWGLKRAAVPWEERYQTLLEYKERFGHVHVPWQWKGNVALAQWVNTQRKKFKDLQDGKRSNLTPDQIEKMNSIGFKWSTGGKGRYTIDSPTPNVVQSNSTFEGGALCNASNPLTALTSVAAPQAKASAVASTATVTADTANSAASQAQVHQTNHIHGGTSTSSLTDSPAAVMPNLQQATMQSNQSHGEMAIAMANELQTRLLAAAVQASGVNQPSVLGATALPQQAIQGTGQSPGLSSTAERLAHQLINQQLIQPQTMSSVGIAAQQQQATPTQLIQQVLTNNQLAPVGLVNHNIISSSTAQQQSQSHSLSVLSNTYTQLLNQQQQQQQNQMNQSPPNASTQPSQNDSLALSNAYKQLLNQQMTQQALASNNVASVPSQQQPNQDASSAISTMFQQLQSAQQQSLGNNQPTNDVSGVAVQTQKSNLANLFQQYLNQQQKK